MAEVVESLKEDSRKIWEVMEAMVEEEEGLLVSQRKFEETREEWKTRVRWDQCLWLMVRNVWMVGLEPMGKAVVRRLESMEEPIDNWWVVKEHDKEGTMVTGWRSNKDEH
ncbi:hypothetical protein Tco_0611241 [Tanacetum coccineum]